MPENSSYKKPWMPPACKVLALTLLVAPSFAQAQTNGVTIPIAQSSSAQPSAAQPAKLTGTIPDLKSRLAPGLPLTDLESAAIATAEADLTALDVGALAVVRHDLAQAYLKAADQSRDIDSLRAAILYAASAVELDPATPTYRMTLGGSYGRYAAIETVAGFAAIEILSSDREATTVNARPATPQSLTHILNAHQRRMRVDHLEKTYPGALRDLFIAALEQAEPTMGVTSKPNDQDQIKIQTLFADELRDLEESRKGLATRQSRWQAQLKELDQDGNAKAAIRRNNVNTQLSRLEIEAEAIGKVIAQLKSWQDQSGLTEFETKRAMPSPAEPARPALVVAREILSLATSRQHGSTEAPLLSLEPEIRALVISARKAGARGWVEPLDAQSIADRDLIESLSRIAGAAGKPADVAASKGTSRQNPPPDTFNADAPQKPTLELVYRPRPTSRPQLAQNPRFVRTGPIESSVPVGATLLLDTHVDIAKSDPQPWIGYTWILYDKNAVNQKPVKINEVVSFNANGNAQIGAHASNKSGPAVLHLPLPTGDLAPGPYEAVVATFYLGDDGTLDPTKAKETTAIARTSFELIEAEIDVYIDLPDRIASPGWTLLTTFASDWAQPPYTIEITLDQLIFRGTEETFVSAKGLSPMMKFGGITTPPDAPAHGAGSVTVEITDARGRTANASRRLVIGGTPQAVIAPSLSQAVEHPE